MMLSLSMKRKVCNFSATPSVEDGVVDEIPSLTAQKRKLFPVNNVPGIQAKCSEIRASLKWEEKLDVTVNTPLKEKKKDNDGDTEAENDFKREMAFYNQALAGVKKALKRLKKVGINTKRPADYFAEMAKSDDHMLKVREKLLSKQTIIERAEKARAIREQKQQGKKIQMKIIEQRKQEKKKMITALKKTKKGKMGADKLLGEKTQNAKKETKSKKKREYRDATYGYGGKKKGSKSNTAESSAFYPGGKGENQNKGSKHQAMYNTKLNFGKKRAKATRRRR